VTEMFSPSLLLLPPQHALLQLLHTSLQTTGGALGTQRSSPGSSGNTPRPQRGLPNKSSLAAGLSKEWSVKLQGP
jgi:hypothetical protein